MNAIEEFNITEAVKLVGDIRKNLFYIRIKNKLRKHIMEVRSTNPIIDEYNFESDDFHFEKNEMDIKQNIPDISNLKKMFESDGFDAKINFEIVNYEKPSENVIDDIFRKTEGSRNIKICVKDTWSTPGSI
jgi:hypothetical protein